MSDTALTRGRYAWNIVATVIVFVTIGPLIGLLAMSLLESGRIGQSIGGFLFTMGWLAPLPYMAGAPAAAFTGLVVAAASPVVRGFALYVLAAVVGAVASPLLFYAIYASWRLTRSSFLQSHRSDVLTIALLGAIAAVGCTWLTKRWRSA